MWTTILIALVLIVGYGLFLYLRREKYVKTKDLIGINSQREIIENNIYRSESLLLDDSNNFIDTTKLLIKFAPQISYETPIPNYSFFESIGIDFRNIPIKDNQAFCLMPFNNNFKTTYEIIKSACAPQGIVCSRSDESYNPGNLLRQILISIVESKVVFAVLDGRNPNVFYELGLCHAIGKPVFLVARFSSKENLPFDISSSRLLLYKSNSDLATKVEKAISQLQSQNG